MDVDPARGDAGGCDAAADPVFAPDVVAGFEDASGVPDGVGDAAAPAGAAALATLDGSACPVVEPGADAVGACVLPGFPGCAVDVPGAGADGAETVGWPAAGGAECVPIGVEFVVANPA